MFFNFFKRKKDKQLEQLRERKQAREGAAKKLEAQPVKELSIECLGEGQGVWCLEELLHKKDVPDRAKTLHSYQRLIQAFPPLPTLWNQLQVAIDEGASAQRVAELIVSEPELAAKLLRFVNSAGYGVSREVSNVHQAVVLLGYNMVKNIATEHHLVGLGGQGQGLYCRAELWRHGMAVSALSMQIAKLFPNCNSGEAATMGLLHDIGRVFLHDLSTRKDFKVKEGFEQQCMEKGGYLLFELKTFGCTHLELGLLLAEHWCLPEKIRHAIEFHHHPSALDMSCVPAQSQVELLVVALANMLAVHAGFIGGNPCKSFIHESYHELLQGVEWESVLDDPHVKKELHHIKNMKL
ncbi:MAG: HDOD domain-containing protein [Mariprofundaceae bacterium]